MLSTNVGWESYLLVAIVFVGLYYYILRCLGFTKQKNSTLASANITPTANSLIPTMMAPSQDSGGMTLPAGIEGYTQSVGGEATDIEGFEFLEEDTDNILLKEAERVVDKIQLAINQTIPPPDAEEVKARLKGIVNPYRVFVDTEYYGAINTYIALSLERDLELPLPPEVIESLWN